LNLVIVVVIFAGLMHIPCTYITAHRTPAAIAAIARDKWQLSNTF